MDVMQIRLFSKAIKDFVKDSNLSIEVKRLALTEILSEVSAEADAALKKELEIGKPKEDNDNGIN